MRVLHRAVVATVLLALATGCSRGDSSSTRLVPSGEDPAEALLYACLDVPGDVAAEVASLPEVDCDRPHTHEIYSVATYQPEPDASGTAVPVDDLSYPGEQALNTFAEAECHRGFDDFVGVEAIDSSLFFSFMVPTLASWNGGSRDRTIICVVSDPAAEGGKTTGSLKNSRR